MTINCLNCSYHNSYYKFTSSIDNISINNTTIDFFFLLKEELDKNYSNRVDNMFGLFDLIVKTIKLEIFK